MKRSIFPIGLLLLVCLLTSCGRDLGEGILLERSDYVELSANEREKTRNLFEGDYYYKVRMISGQLTVDTINAVLIENQKYKGDTVRIICDGKEHDLLLITSWK